MGSRTMLAVICALLVQIASAEIVEYEFDISTITVAVTDKKIPALAIDGSIPAPTLYASVGDILRATFHNKLNEVTSVHWHGILLPADQDGVPYLNTQPILPGQSHTFEFPITHAGTFWYHSHTNLQIQRGLYGGIVLRDPNEKSAAQDEVVVLSDWTDTKVERVLQNLKSDEDFYAFKRNTVQSWDQVFRNGPSAIRNRISSSYTRMGPMDLTDVYYDAFLANGKVEESIPLSHPDISQVKLRLINGSTSSYYDVEYAGGPMTIIAADGQNVEPIKAQRLRISTAETYDVLVPVEQGKSFELRANSFDGSGYSRTFLGDGEKIAAPDMARPNLFTMNSAMHGNHMAMTSGSHNTADPDHGNHVAMESTDHSMHQNEMKMDKAVKPEQVIPHMTDYSQLVALVPTTLPSTQKWRDITLSLTGSMERYVWSFNGNTFRESPQILIRKGENVRLHFNNDTMMHHPLHLHGHFFRVVNQAGEYSPLKHTVNVPPMSHVMIEFDANEDQDWLFHCHNQYHMKSGMSRVVSYEESSNFNGTIEDQLQAAQRYFQVNEFHLMTSFSDYEFSLFDERHELRLEFESDLAGRNESYSTYNYHFNRFLSGFIGYQDRDQEEEENRDVAVAGLNITLPFLIDSEWRVDDDGEFRLELESEVLLTKRLGFDWRWNTDNEYRYGLNYRLNSRWAVTLHTDKEYGDGVGVKFFY